ncbi:Uncharacterised protein [Streptococcus pyogenes]|uniref:hypothetical protein n=1 Tax=Streptococcus pyogenes TaxID=1314 RepID=UPI00109CFBE5|nr:hypothetical protein [Streptococcus pyogenes]VGV45296.1 Uncharacterised protein [Streptococcus pyogenes]VGV45308.1 Uncharacterised protein [Streptococcus pyogenes]VGZ14489.1 Uncharacterised protein [Streptococcus pyogenes]VGZ45273.1 Uncharacterised protein [Streptococcus pyogenes]VHD66224.1 Uncharacterised protein [Streptococcus pyogenes]
MKTKSKRFLNLATLCLALLGTTLLMGQPVKADVSTPETVQTSAGSDNDGDEYTENWHKGYGEGYKEGSNPDAEEKDVTELDKIAKDKARAKNAGYGYSDGYQSGYYRASYETHHPIMAAIGSFLDWLWSLFTEE